MKVVSAGVGLTQLLKKAATSICALCSTRLICNLDRPKVQLLVKNCMASSFTSLGFSLNSLLTRHLRINFVTTHSQTTTLIGGELPERDWRLFLRGFFS